MKRIALLIPLVALSLPQLAHAQSLKSFTAGIVTLVNSTLVPLIYALAFILFLIGMVRYFFLEQGEEGRDKGKQLMIWGLIGFVVMSSVWGIVRLFLSIVPGYGA